MRISAKSEMLMSQVYSSNWTALALWPKHGKQYKYLMFVFMEHLKRENVVVIGMLLPVNLETFSAVSLFESLCASFSINDNTLQFIPNRLSTWHVDCSHYSKTREDAAISN